MWNKSHFTVGVNGRMTLLFCYPCCLFFIQHGTVYMLVQYPIGILYHYQLLLNSIERNVWYWQLQLYFGHVNTEWL